MAEQAQPSAISAAFPAPPPFYKSFTNENLERQKEYLDSIGHSSSEPPSLADPKIDLLPLPPELRNLFPPPPPPEGKYRSFGEEQDVSPESVLENQIVPTPERLHALTRSLLLSFLSLTNALATDPGAYAPIWEELHTAFKEVHEVINRYRPHQARETLIFMMEEQIEKVRAETKAVQENMEKARKVLEGLGNRDSEIEEIDSAIDKDLRKDKKELNRAASDKRIWEILDGKFSGDKP